MSREGFEELSEAERYAVRYNLIVIVEATLSQRK
jgi:uncharacterized protein YutE (UPF0331/DUF86 family)